MSFLAKILGLTALMILALAGVMACVIFLFIETPDGRAEPAPLILGAILCLAIGLGALWMMIGLNNQWKSEFSAKFDNEPQQLLASWSVPPEIWWDFAETEKTREHRDAGFTSCAVGGILGVVIFLSMISPSDFGTAFLVSLAVAFGSAGLIWVIQRLSSGARYGWRRRQNAVEIGVRPDGMRVNRKIVIWNQFGAILTKKKVEPASEEASYGIFEVEVRVLTGRGNHVSRTHRAPVPIDATTAAAEAAAKLISE